MGVTAPDWSGGGAHWQLVRAAWEALVDRELVDVTQRELCRAAGVSPSLFRKYFWRKTDLAGEVAAAAYAVFTANMRAATTCADLVERWHTFARALPRHYDLLFSQEHGMHSKIWYQREGLEDHVAALVERELEATLFSARPVVAILHGSIGASASPRMTAAETLDVVTTYVSRWRRPPTAPAA